MDSRIKTKIKIQKDFFYEIFFAVICTYNFI